METIKEKKAHFGAEKEGVMFTVTCPVAIPEVVFDFAIAELKREIQKRVEQHVGSRMVKCPVSEEHPKGKRQNPEYTSKIQELCSGAEVDMCDLDSLIRAKTMPRKSFSKMSKEEKLAFIASLQEMVE